MVDNTAAFNVGDGENFFGYTTTAPRCAMQNPPLRDIIDRNLAETWFWPMVPQHRWAG